MTTNPFRDVPPHDPNVLCDLTAQTADQTAVTSNRCVLNVSIDSKLVRFVLSLAGTRETVKCRSRACAEQHSE